MVSGNDMLSLYTQAKKEAKLSLFAIADKVGKEIKNGTFEDINKDEHFANVVYYLEIASIYGNRIVGTILTAIFSIVLFSIIGINFKIPLVGYLVIMMIVLLIKGILIYTKSPFNTLKSLSSNSIDEDIILALLEKAKAVDSEKIINIGKKIVSINILIVILVVVVGMNIYINPFIYIFLLLLSIISLNNKVILHYANK